jgi:hypothetical protein
MSKKTTGGAAMIDRHPINLVRIQDIEESFAFLEHRFLPRGFWAGPCHQTLLHMCKKLKKQCYRIMYSNIHYMAFPGAGFILLPDSAGHDRTIEI